MINVSRVFACSRSVWSLFSAQHQEDRVSWLEIPEAEVSEAIGKGGTEASDTSNLIMSSISPVQKEDGGEGGNRSLKSKRIVERQQWKK